MTTTLRALADEALARGTLPGLPTQHFLGGRFEPSAGGERLAVQDPGTGRDFTNTLPPFSVHDLTTELAAVTPACANPFSM